jgi:hypothetical protein
MNIRLFTTTNQQLAEKVREYLVAQFPMARDSNPVVIPYDYKYAQKGSVQVAIVDENEYWSRYSNTIEKMQNAATDFVAGYELGQQNPIVKPKPIRVITSKVKKELA